MTEDYYTQKLSAERLRQCYRIAPARVQRYLEAEIEFVLARIRPTDRVLELGCGYGRVLERLLGRAGMVVGIDTAPDSLRLARTTLAGPRPCHLAVMNALRPGFPDQRFDRVLCLQNGISAFHVDPQALIKAAVRMTCAGGIALFSSYAAGFWPDRLAWFRLQAEQGLIGEIDEAATGNGVIVGRDGFRATTVEPADFVALTTALGLSATVTEVDGSSLFCEIEV